MTETQRDRLVVKGMGPHTDEKVIDFLNKFLSELLTMDAQEPMERRTTLNLSAALSAPPVDLTFHQKNVLGNMAAFLDDIDSLEWRHSVFNRVRVTREEMAALLMRTETARVLQSVPDFNAEQLAVVVLNPHGVVSTKDDGTATATPYGHA